MTLKEFLDQNPAARAEFNEAIENAKKAGAEVVNQRVEQSAHFLGAESSYPESIRNLAVDTMTGKVGIESLNAAVAAYDAIVESKKSEEGQLETGEQGDIGDGQPPVTSEDGIVRNDADHAEAVARVKAKRGA